VEVCNIPSCLLGRHIVLLLNFQTIMRHRTMKEIRRHLGHLKTYVTNAKTAKTTKELDKWLWEIENDVDKLLGLVEKKDDS